MTKRKRMVILMSITAATLAAVGLAGAALTGVTPAAHAESPLYWANASFPIFEGGGAYPRMVQLRDGTLLCGFDAGLGAPNARIAIARSEDGGKTWAYPIIGAEKAGFDCANANFIQLENGDILLAYRAIKGGENIDAKILCNISHDNGHTWEFHSTVIEEYGKGGVWEPHFIMIDGKVAVFYANDSHNAMGDTGFQNIEFKLWEGDHWGEKRIASNGNETKSRDGMPIVDRLSDGRYVMVVEANAFPDYVFIVQIKFSPDGLDWSEPLRTIYTPIKKGAGKKAGAPYIAVLPGDILVVSFQTDEDATGSGDGVSTMKVIASSDLGETWSAPFTPFPVPDGKSAIWNGMYWANDQLWALTSANYPRGGIYARTATLEPHTDLGTNLLVNPTFADNSLLGWTLTDGKRTWGQEYGSKRFIEADGVPALYLIRNKQTRPLTISQHFQGVQGGTYEFTVSLANSQGTGDVNLILTQGETVQTFPLAPTDALQTFSVANITLTDGSLTLALEIPASGANAITLSGLTFTRVQ